MLRKVQLQFESTHLSASLDNIRIVTDRQYQQAMNHIHKFNFLYADKDRQRKEQQFDPECTFRPKLYKNNFNTEISQAKKQKNIRFENRLQNWGLGHTARNRKNVIQNNFVLQLSKSRQRARQEVKKKMQKSIYIRGVDKHLQNLAKAAVKKNGGNYLYISGK